MEPLSRAASLPDTQPTDPKVNYFNRVGGAEGDRTPDLRIANATLSQLSYGPVYAIERGVRPQILRPLAPSAGAADLW